MHTIVRRLAAISPALLLTMSACLPYTVGSTARTVPAGKTTESTSYYFIPNGYKLTDDTIPAPLYGGRLEVRHGLDGRSDLGLSILPAGVAFDYKRRVDGDVTGTGTAVAFAAGAGIVNAGEHLMFVGTLIVSGREDVGVAPFGGVRAIQLVRIGEGNYHDYPLGRVYEGAVHDRATIGVFGGAQLGDSMFMIRPEVGVFYDPPSLGVRRRNVIFVPAVTIQRRRTVERHELGEERPARTRRGAPSPGQPRGCVVVSCATPGMIPIVPPAPGRWMPR